MTDNTLTAIQLVIDRSGSMDVIKTDAQGAINSFIDDQKKEPGQCLVRLTEFDNQIDVVFPLTDIHDVGSYELQPRAMTALYDAIGKSIVELGADLAKMDEKDRPGHVLFVIVTDGQENSSREYPDSMVIKRMIEEHRDQYSWDFVYLAANQDAVLAARQFGIQQDSALTYSHSGVGAQSAMSSASYYASSVRGGYKGTFTDDDRRRAGETQ
jgi:uncharacterized protein YegL